jgi:peptidoglycan hydrolase-like protein with peptidoglycan-binding domain
MKNLFIITEEERKRILGLHESATKRQYLSEQESEETKLRKSLNPIANEITMIVSGNRFQNVDETKLINAILKIPDVSTLNAVNNDLKRYYANKTNKYTGLDAVIADSIGTLDSGKERLRPHLQKLLGWNSTQNLGTSNFKFPDLSVIMANQIQRQRDTASQNTKTNTTTQQQNKDNNTTQKTADTGKANPDTTQVKQRTVPTSTEQLTQKGYYLRKGDKGPLVNTIQTRLIDAGEDVALTSIFDDMTKKAVMSFQTKNNLVNSKTKQPDGVVGPKTWGILSNTNRENMKSKEVTSIPTNTNEPADNRRTPERPGQDFNYQSNQKGVAPEMTPIPDQGQYGNRTTYRQ